MKSAYLAKINPIFETETEEEFRLLNGKKSFRIIAFFILAIWCFGFTFGSLFTQSKALILYPLIKEFYSTVCHQIAYKTIEMNGINFLVCARCSGIYFGGLLSSIIFLFTTRSYKLDVKFIFLAAIPMTIDVILHSSDVYTYSKIIALATGFIFGFVTIGFVLISIENLFIKGNNKVQ